LTAIASRTLASLPSSTSKCSTTEYPRGVRYSSQGSLRISRKHFGADDRSLAALSARLAFSSSSDGLGIHQPGSNTRGGFFTATAPSGRARQRAICPAVARSNRRAA
jgi:hypothetical protein